MNTIGKFLLILVMTTMSQQALLGQATYIKVKPLVTSTIKTRKLKTIANSAFQSGRALHLKQLLTVIPNLGECTDTRCQLASNFISRYGDVLFDGQKPRAFFETAFCKYFKQSTLNQKLTVNYTSLASGAMFMDLRLLTHMLNSKMTTLNIFLIDKQYNPDNRFSTEYKTAQQLISCLTTTKNINFNVYLIRSVDAYVNLVKQQTFDLPDCIIGVDMESALLEYDKLTDLSPKSLAMTLEKSYGTSSTSGLIKIPTARIEVRLSEKTFQLQSNQK